MSGVQQVTPRGQILRWMPVREGSYCHHVLITCWEHWATQPQWFMTIFNGYLVPRVACHTSTKQVILLLTARYAGMQIVMSQSGALEVLIVSVLTIRAACLSITRSDRAIYWLFPQYLVQMQSLSLNTFTNTGLAWTSLTLLWVSPFEIPYSHLKWIIKLACAQLRFQPRIFFFWNLKRGRSTVSIY